MPHTVRRVGAAIDPTVSATNVANVWLEKHGRKASNSRGSDAGEGGVDTSR
jgi:hypothetical protein